MKITIGDQMFIATLNDSETTKALKTKLPLNVKMTELHGNEKYYDLPHSLPTNPATGGSIKSGDLMMYGNNVLVLFYKSFQTSYPYTKLGSIENPDALAAVVGSGDVTVSFENY